MRLVSAAEKLKQKKLQLSNRDNIIKTNFAREQKAWIVKRISRLYKKN